MKLLPILCLGALGSQAHAALLLTAIYDGSSSSPKGVEIYVTSDGSYEGWTLGGQSNAATGAFSTGYTFDATSYSTGDFIYVTSTATDPAITAQMGIIIADNSFNQNGDDRIQLTDGTNVIDQFGVSGVDGTGEAWEYTDSFAVRNSGTTASGDFVLADWTVAPINTLDPGNEPLVPALSSYTVPEPSTAFLGGLALLGLARRRRI